MSLESKETEAELALRELLLHSLAEVVKHTPHAHVWETADLLWGRITAKFRYQLKTDVEETR